MRILIVKIGALGDVAMALSMVEAVRRDVPQARVTWLCGRGVAPLLEAYGRLDEICTVDETRLFAAPLARRLLCLVGVWRRLFLRSFDLIVTGHADRRYRLLSLTARAKTRRSFGVRGRRDASVPGRSHAQEYVRLIAGAERPGGVATPPPRVAPSLDAQFASQIAAGRACVALVPGGARNVLRDDALRRWPVEHWARLATRLADAGCQVFLTGSESDAWVRPHFEGRGVVDWIGATSVTDLLAFYARCRVVITPDSGPMHLAVLAGAPVVALFGPTTPSEKTPAGDAVRVLWGGAHLACRPCYDGRNYADCPRNVCMEDLEVGAVFDAAKRILDAGR